MPEWSIGAVSKTVVPFRHPGFESLSLRRMTGIRVRDLISRTLVIISIPD